MPHLVIEYTDNLRPFPEARILEAVNASLTASPEILAESDLKSRYITTDRFAIGTQPEGRAFVHAQLRLLSGRSPEAKQDLAGRVGAVLRAHTPRPEGLAVQLSVEIVDMDRGSYVKEKL
ncbi:5-carboxymethyl-2-hydroxymuconate Delta-isomerase [Paracidovorax konjaci]|uniref:5-carboxymethyl-2-hydroxymuconate isomerase n=1 Tax=Paracidovorax konjaci TaxID=32040 RepID=A0A1I1SPW3_9BURK|nr:5-carboxymethyl-2-hydroxymuconate Delta-isomerase [Paracidovorax konjaci]SFD46768.1 5-carboxymethyl-2-hydroxymuconate isomerase [Paracidovorax konjaci]